MLTNIICNCAFQQQEVKHELTQKNWGQLGNYISLLANELQDNNLIWQKCFQTLSSQVAWKRTTTLKFKLPNEFWKIHIHKEMKMIQQ